jgi:hypothetical protein
VTAGAFLAYILLGFCCLVILGLAVLGGWMLWRIFEDLKKP